MRPGDFYCPQCGVGDGGHWDGCPAAPVGHHGRLQQVRDSRFGAWLENGGRLTVVWADHEDGGSQ